MNNTIIKAGLFIALLIISTFTLGVVIANPELGVDQFTIFMFISAVCAYFYIFNSWLFNKLRDIKEVKTEAGNISAIYVKRNRGLNVLLYKDKLILADDEFVMVGYSDIDLEKEEEKEEEQ